MKLIHALRRSALPLMAGVLAVTTFVGCNANVRIGVGRSYDRVWHGDPYCRYSWDRSCRYGYDDGYRVGIIWRNRHHNRGHWLVAEQNKKVSWAQEFNLNSRAVKTLRTSFKSALNGNYEALRDLGLGRSDIYAMTRFQMPSDASINTAARELRVNTSDLRDFLEVFMIRMKTALAKN